MVSALIVIKASRVISQWENGSFKTDKSETMEMLKLMMNTGDYLCGLGNGLGANNNNAILHNNNNNNNSIDDIKKDQHRARSPDYRVPPINLDELPEVLLCKCCTVRCCVLWNGN